MRPIRSSDPRPTPRHLPISGSDHGLWRYHSDVLTFGRRYAGAHARRARTGAWVIALDVGGQKAIAGFMVLGDGWIEQLYLEPDCTGRRLGDHLIGLAKERCPGGLQLWTFAVNAAARRFYVRHGFVEVEHTDGAANEEREPDVRLVWRPQT